MKLKIPHTFVIVTFVLILCGILTWIIPSGEFERTKVIVDSAEREVIVENSYHRVESNPQTWQILGSIVEGFKHQAGIIAFILIIGGAFGLLNSTKAIDRGICSFLENSKKWEKSAFLKKIGVNNLIIIVCMLIFSLFGAIFGMSEETIAFVIIIVPLAISMGYDSITGLLMVYVAAHIGFSGAIFNPFTIGIAQGLSGLPLFSGFEYRCIVWLILTTLIIIVTIVYARKIKASPESSPTYKIDRYWRERISTNNMENGNNIANVDNTSKQYKPSVYTYIIYALLTIIFIVAAILYPTTSFQIGQKTINFVCLPVISTLFVLSGYIAIRKGVTPFVLTILAFTILMLIIGVLGYGWYISEISTLFLVMGISAAISAGFGGNKVATEFISGAKDILSAALVVGLAGGIIEILTDGKILDTMLYKLSQTISSSEKVGGVGAMYTIQTILNLFIPSGSAKAALTMPIMAPFSDIIGLSRQATVMAFQLGDGFTNMITPTSGVLLGALGAAKVPYSVWIKWFWKILLIFVVIGFLLLIPTVLIDLPGF